jgi:hypothetical protein
MGITQVKTTLIIATEYTSTLNERSKRFLNYQQSAFAGGGKAGGKVPGGQGM